MRTRWFSFVLFLSLVVVLLGVSTPATRAQSTEEDAALQVIARINAYRLQNGRFPLAVNDTLVALGLAQAQYVIGLSPIPEGGAIHRGPNGEFPAERAVLAPYNWPSYGQAARTAIGENAGIGGIPFVMQFWQNSSTHNTTMLNREYREIGVGSVPHRFGHLFIVVFGSRPNQLPVLVNPLTNELYLSNEYYSLNSLQDAIHEVRTVQLLDAAGTPLGDPIPWRSTVSIPANAGATLQVRFDDGQRQVTTVVDLQRDIVVLPDTLDIVRNLPAVEPTDTLRATPAATTAPAIATTPPSTASAAATSTPIPTTAPTATSVPTTTPTAVASTPDLRITYNTRWLAILNVSGTHLDITDLVLVGGERRLASTAWAQFSPVSLNLFPPDACLQVWAWSEPSVLPQPQDCRVRLSYIFVAPERRFWANADFTVEYKGETIATCRVNGLNCEVTLP